MFHNDYINVMMISCASILLNFFSWIEQKEDIIDDEVFDDDIIL